MYLINFALLNDTAAASPYSNSFAVLFGGNTIYSMTAVPVGPYTTYSFLAPSSASSTLLSFVSRNDGGYFELDSVSVTAAAGVTPEPSTLLMVGTGLLSAVTGVRRKFRFV